MAHLKLISKSDERSVIIRAECVKIAGDLVVGALLSQILYWSSPSKSGKSKLRVQKYGHYWIAKSRSEWMEETGLSLEQYKRAIKVLVSKGLVEVRQMLYSGKNISHVRILNSGVKPTTQVVANTPLQWGETHHSNTDTTNRDYTESSGEDASRTEETEDSRESPSRGIPNLDKRMDAEDILERRKQKQPDTGKINLNTFWQQRMALLTEEFQKPLTQKEKGQLNHIKKSLGDDSRAVIDYALANWFKFAHRAGTDAGTSFPLTPNIGFLAKHYHVAVNLLREKSEKSSATVQPIAEKETPPAESPPEVEQEQPHHLTDDELAQMIAGLKE